jgi:hypothetical protein
LTVILEKRDTIPSRPLNQKIQTVLTICGKRFQEITERTEGLATAPIREVTSFGRHDIGIGLQPRYVRQLEQDTLRFAHVSMITAIRVHGTRRIAAPPRCRATLFANTPKSF